MSWSIKTIGTKPNVIAQVKHQLIDSTLAPALGALIIEEINAIKDPAPCDSWSAGDLVQVEGNGHRGSGIEALKIVSYIAAVPPPVQV